MSKKVPELSAFIGSKGGGNPESTCWVRISRLYLIATEPAWLMLMICVRGAQRLPDLNWASFLQKWQAGNIPLLLQPDL